VASCLEDRIPLYLSMDAGYVAKLSATGFIVRRNMQMPWDAGKLIVVRWHGARRCLRRT
jgi:hypothetical protein